MEKLKLEEVAPHEWVFVYPDIDELNERFYDAVDIMDAEPEKADEIFCAILKKFPEHIDAIHYRSILKEIKGKTKDASELIKKAVKIGKACLPRNFSGKDRLEWGFLENRPFLRALHSLGLTFFEGGEPEDALSVFNDLLTLNPDDNQGIRALAVGCNFMLNRPEAVLELCDKYPDDCMAETLYGRPLAFFQLGREKEAKKALKNAIKDLPRVAKELVKTKHKKPKSMMEEYLTWGGEDEAYDYWKNCGRFWEETPGAVELVKSTLEKKK